MKYLKIAIFISVLFSVIGINFCSKPNPLKSDLGVEADTTGPLLSNLQVVMGLAQYCTFRYAGSTVPCFTSEEKVDCTPPFSSNQLKYEVSVDSSFSIGIAPLSEDKPADFSIALDNVPCRMSMWNMDESYYTCGPTNLTKTFEITIKDSNNVQNVYTLTVNRK
jgi:hypothetical protein